MQLNHGSLLIGLTLAVCAAAHATENQVSTPNGADGFLAGALPPPGTYNLLFVNHYQADRLNDGSGRSLIPSGFKVTANVLADKVLHMTGSTLVGGNVGFYAAVPLIDLKVAVPGLEDHRSGVGDVEGGVIVGWHADDLHWYGLGALVVPTGSWEATRLANLGSNYVTLRPQFGFSYLPKSGLDLSARLTYSINATNRATGYRSGQYVHADFNAGTALSEAWKLGLQGYYLQQTTDDEQGGAAVGADGHRARVLALGPGAVFQSNGVSYEFKVLRETRARYRAEGTSAWLKIVWRL